MSAKLLLTLAACVLSGCSGLPERSSRAIASADASASTLVTQVGQTAPGVVLPRAVSVEHDRGIWLGKKVVKVGPPPLPPLFSAPAAFDRPVASLQELAERLSLRSGVPIQVSPDAVGAPGPGGMASVPAPPADNGSARLAALMAGAGATPAPAPSSPARAESGVRIAYNGTFKGLLDTAAARFGVSWKYSEGTIRFFLTETRTFQLNTIPGDSSYSATVSSGASSSGGEGAAAGAGAGAGNGAATGVNANNRQNTAINTQLSVYANIEKSVAAMLSPRGKVVASPATGSLTVVDTPDVLERVAVFMENENEALSRQVAINVTVLAVTLNDADEYGIKWDLVYSNLMSKYGIRNTLSAQPNGVGFSAGVLGDSRWAGSTVLINALAEQGKVRRQTTATVVTLNNQPVPVQVAKQTSYLKSSQSTVTALVGNTTTLTPGTITSGFNMSILPHVLNNGTVMLQFSIDISALRSIRTVNSNNSTLETPELDTRNFLQRVAMKSNETLIISGFEQTDDTVNHQGTGSATNMLFGGAVKAQRDKEVIVILITPTAMESA